MTSAAARALNIAELREMARRRLPAILYDFLDDGAEENYSMSANRRIFECIRFRPRTLVDVSARATAIEVWGRRWAMPVAIGPTGIAGLMGYRADFALARAAARAGVPFVLSTASTAAMEEVREASDGAMWFQLYMSKDREAARGLVERARAAGYEALVMTSDVVVGGNRERNQRNGFAIPFRLRGATLLDGLLHPRWLAGTFLRTLATSGPPRLRNLDAAREGRVVTRSYSEFRADRTAVNWDEIRWLRDAWPGRLMVKGVLHEGDAVRAAECGVDGIFVSNHGGRQLDGAITPVEALPPIVRAVGGRMEVFVDSGFRRGADVVKAVCLGARAAFTGRATLYGAIAGGEEGALRALEIFRSEIDRVLALLGANGMGELGPHFVECPFLGAGAAAAGSTTPTEAQRSLRAL